MVFARRVCRRHPGGAARQVFPTVLFGAALMLIGRKWSRRDVAKWKEGCGLAAIFFLTARHRGDVDCLRGDADRRPGNPAREGFARPRCMRRRRKPRSLTRMMAFSAWWRFRLHRAIEVGGNAVIETLQYPHRGGPLNRYHQNRGHFIEEIAPGLLPKYPLGRAWDAGA